MDNAVDFDIYMLEDFSAKASVQSLLWEVNCQGGAVPVDQQY
jgi:hypothetical protein